MNATKLILLLFLALFLNNISNAQIVINEISNMNSGQIADEEYNDWIELYNTSSSAINLQGYYLSDDSLNLEKWPIPSYSLAPSQYLTVFASGKNRITLPGNYHWESPVLDSHIFDYIIPTAATPVLWMKPDFITTGWSQGNAGFGFGDNDDATVVPLNSMAVYIRKTFTIPAGYHYKEVDLHVDYDDGFVAYLNGTEIARNLIGGTPAWNSSALAEHEAVLYTKAIPEKIALDTALIRSLLVEGTNVFAIEVHNYGATSNDLSLIPFLSFMVNTATYSFDKTPITIIPPLKPFCLHTNFKISSKGEKVYLFNKLSNHVESVWVKELSAGWSIGRVSDGAQLTGIFIQPTPASSNITRAYPNIREPEPVFSVSEGYYSNTQQIALSSSSTTAQIRYTIDGSEPTATSYLYNGTPVTIPASTIMRATCFSTVNKLPSRSSINTYFINNAGHTLPVFSITTGNDNLYGDNGIFTNAGKEWEKPCYVEYFDKNKVKQFEQFAGMQIDGGAGGSRYLPQHSFRLEFDDKVFGEGDVDETLIPDRPERNDYKSVYLRNGSSQNLIFQFKDAMQTKMMSLNTLNYYSACTPAVVYINGSYFGVYEMREKLNDEYFEVNYNATIDSTFHLLSRSTYYKYMLRALHGSTDTFTIDYNNFLKLDHADVQYLTKADKILDLDYYTDYIIAQSWIGNTDWPINNIKIVKGDFTNHRWRFILQDLEWALNPNGWTDSNYDHIEYLLNNNQGSPYLRFWLELMKDPVYKGRFINRFADLMNTSYLPENTTAIAQSVYDDSYAEMRAEYVQWGGGEEQANTNMTQYANNLATFKSELNNRSNVVRSNIMSHFGLSGTYNIELQVLPAEAGQIQVNTITPRVYPWTGIYFAGLPIRIEAKGTGNYVFDSWEPNTFIKDVKNPVIEADIKLSGYKFIARFKLKAPEQAITISEVNYVSGDLYPASDWLELYNYGQNAMNLTGWYLTDSNPAHKWVFPGSLTLQSGERIVLASNLTKFKAVYPNVKNVIGSFDFGLGTPTDQVHIYNSNNQLMAGMEYSSTAPWPTGPFDKGMTLELKDPNLDLNNPSNWLEGCVGGSPGVAYAACPTATTPPFEKIKASLFPNPATDNITVVLPASTTGKLVTIRLLDMMGKQVKIITKQYVGQSNIEIPVSNLYHGVYMVRISDNNNEQTLKFIKK
jgi:hypothetical protein